MRILVVTNMYPTNLHPHFGTFVEQQVTGLRQIGMRIDVLLSDRARHGIKAYFKLDSAIRSAIIDNPPALVHVMYGGVMASIVTRTVRSCPVVVSFCGSDLLGERGAGLQRCLMANYGVWASHRAAYRAQGIIVKSNNLFWALPKKIASERVQIIPNGIDMDRFIPMPERDCRRQLGWNVNRFHVLFATNTGAPLKRPWLARASVDVLKANGLDAELHFLQGVRHDDVPYWLNASSVILLTSEHEGSPNIVKEALSCNRPIVSVEVGDVAERISGIQGCFLAAPDPEALANALQKVAKGAGQVDGRSRLHNLSLKNVSYRLSEFYSSIIYSNS